MNRITQAVDQQIATGAVIIVNQAIDQEGVTHLIQRDPNNVTILILQGAFLGSQALKLFHEAQFANLVTVELKNNEINNLGCKYLSKCSLNNMKKLSLSSNHIDGFGVIHLQKKSWQKLTSFSLYNNKIEINGVRFLSKAKWPSLMTICLSKGQIRSEELTYLLSLEQSLKRLYLTIPDNEYLDRKYKMVENLLQKFDGAKQFSFC